MQFLAWNVAPWFKSVPVGCLPFFWHLPSRGPSLAHYPRSWGTGERSHVLLMDFLYRVQPAGVTNHNNSAAARQRRQSHTRSRRELPTALRSRNPLDGSLWFPRLGRKTGMSLRSWAGKKCPADGGNVVTYRRHDRIKGLWEIKEKN